MINFEITKNSDSRLRARMAVHYSQPRGFVGRNICLAVHYNGVYYGHIVFGSATRFLPGRNEALGIELKDINKVANNLFYNISKVDGKYPARNFTTKVLKAARQEMQKIWPERYDDELVGFETLVEPPRTGELYLKDGWQIVGRTIGYTCKRVSGPSTDGWGGARVWNKDLENLRPKIVLVKPVVHENAERVHQNPACHEAWQPIQTVQSPAAPHF